MGVFVFLSVPIWIVFSSKTIFKNPVLFESLESKTPNQKPVYNQVQYFQQGKKDIWMMNQSHHGVGSAHWDRLAIVVDQSVRPKTAAFYQLQSGPLQWQEKFRKIDYRVSCFVCHSNGPRAIRADTNAYGLSFQNRAQIFLWNFKIKTYGRVLSVSGNLDSKTPFEFPGKVAHRPLEIASCIRCHQNEGWISRGPLTLQNSLAIRFMLEKKLMPPWPLSITPGDQSHLTKFLRGL